MEAKRWKAESLKESDLDQVISIEEKTFSDGLWSEELIRKVFKNSPDAFCVVKDGSKVVGFVSTAESWNLANYNFEGQTGFIDNIAVEEDYREQGVGSVLVAASVEKLKRKGAQKVSFCTRVSNISMQKLGEKFGFKNTGISPDDQYPDGEDAYGFELLISD